MQSSLNPREKMRRYRKRLRASGLRPIQIWVPDTRSKHFSEEIKRQSLLVSSSSEDEAVMNFIEAASDTEEWE